MSKINLLKQQSDNLKKKINEIDNNL